MRFKLAIWIVLAGFSTAFPLRGQGTFQNLDFENGTFVPIGGDPYFVQPDQALPGWSAYVGTNQAGWVLHNSLSLNPTAGIAIWGPHLTGDFMQGHYYIVLQAGDDPYGGATRVNAAIAQTGRIPVGVQSLRFFLASGAILASFDGQPIPLTNLGIGGGSGSTSYEVYGGDVSAFASQTGLLQLRGVGYLDNIQFSSQPIPEPTSAVLLGLGMTALLRWGRKVRRK